MRAETVVDMRYAVVACVVACLFSVELAAQKKSLSYSDDAGFTVGVNVPMYHGVESDVTLGLTYGHFNKSGIGFRTGFQYTPSVAHVDNSFGIPIAFAYRTGYRSDSQRYLSGIHGASSAASWNMYNWESGSSTFRNMLVSFLTGMFSNVEFTAGLTPGFIAGASSSVGTGYFSGADWQKEWTERVNRMSLTLDAGASLNYSIWRFDLKLMPAFHYSLTDNYVCHRERGNDNATGTFSSELPLRWFFTFSGGLAFRF